MVNKTCCWGVCKCESRRKDHEDMKVVTFKRFFDGPKPNEKDVWSGYWIRRCSRPHSYRQHFVCSKPDDQLLVVGMADKMLSIQRRKPEAQPREIAERPKRNSRLRGHLHQAKAFVPSKTDSVVALKRKELLAPYDRQLKSFNHSKALDAALQMKIRRTTPEVTVSVMQELIRRGHIRAALAGREDASLCAILQFIHKNLSNPNFMSTLLDVFNLILDIYGISEFMNSGPLESLVLKIKELVNTEVRLMTSVQEVMGSLDLLFTVAENQTVPLSKTKIQSSQSSARDILNVDGDIDMDVEDSKGLTEKPEATASNNQSLLSSIGSLATDSNFSGIKS